MIVKKLYILHAVEFNNIMIIIARRLRASLRTFNFSFTLQKTVLPWCVYLEYSRTAYNSSRAFTYIFRERSAKTVRSLQGRLFKYIIRALHCV